MKILLSNSSKEPFYNQIYGQIKSMILSDELKDGEGLPSMRKLARDLGVSVITVKRAYDELEKYCTDQREKNAGCRRTAAGCGREQ